MTGFDGLPANAVALASPGPEACRRAGPAAGSTDFARTRTFFAIPAVYIVSVVAGAIRPAVSDSHHANSSGDKQDGPTAPI